MFIGRYLIFAFMYNTYASLKYDLTNRILNRVINACAFYRQRLIPIFRDTLIILVLRYIIGIVIIVGIWLNSQIIHH